MSNIVVQDFTKDQLALIKATVAKGATDDELSLFIYRCKNMGLDPLKPGQIHFAKYGNSPGTIITGIDGFRTRAAKTGKHTGTKRGVIRDDKGKCTGAWCEVYRSDWTECAREEVALSEYNTNKAQWVKMPETMIKKVAEVAALRMAFPDELGGLYSEDEMAQAHESTVREVSHSVVQAPSVKMIPFDIDAENAEFAPSEYVVKFGKWKGQKLSELDVYQLDNYVNHIKKSSAEKGETIRAGTLEFLTAAENFMLSREFVRT